MIQRQEVIAATEQKRNDSAITVQSRKQIRCRQGRYNRRLFDHSVEGIWLLCKECRREHLVTWEQLEDMRNGYRLFIVHSTSVL